MKTTIDRLVSDMTPQQRDAIQDLIGGDLAPDQRVFILAYHPATEPSEDEKSRARTRIQQLLAKSHSHLNEVGTDEAEADVAITEAIRNADN